MSCTVNSLLIPIQLSFPLAFDTIPHHCDYRNSKFLRNHLIFSAEKWSFLRHSGSKEERGKGLFRILADLFIVAIMLHRREPIVSRLRSFKLGVWYKYQLRVIHIRCFSHYCHYKIRSILNNHLLTSTKNVFLRHNVREGGGDKKSFGRYFQKNEKIWVDFQKNMC